MINQTIEGFCPHCNRLSILEVRSQISNDAPKELFDRLEEGEDGLRSGRYSLAFCRGCDQAFLHVCAESEPSGIPHAVMLFPRPSVRDIPGMPKDARSSFESAWACYKTGNYEPSILMSRKCLEAMCISLGERAGTLAQRLENLKVKGLIEPRLFEWAKELRLAGNAAAHDFSSLNQKEDALDCLEFVEAILLYGFALGQRFKEFQSRRSQAKRGN